MREVKHARAVTREGGVGRGKDRRIAAQFAGKQVAVRSVDRLVGSNADGDGLEGSLLRGERGDGARVEPARQENGVAVGRVDAAAEHADEALDEVGGIADMSVGSE